MKIPGDTSTLPLSLSGPGSSMVPEAHYYGRLDGAAYFKTAMTAPKPYQKNAYFIHPSVRCRLSV